MDFKQQLKDGFAAMNEATNNIAADITRINEKLSGQLTDEEKTALKVELSGIVTRLQEVAAVTPEEEEAPAPTE